MRTNECLVSVKERVRDGEKVVVGRQCMILLLSGSRQEQKSCRGVCAAVLVRSNRKEWKWRRRPW